MAIKLFNYQIPTLMRGLEDHFPAELQDAALEIVRRVDTRFNALESAIRNQIPVDTSILPTQASGAATETLTTTLATSADAEGAELEAIIWNM